MSNIQKKIMMLITSKVNGTIHNIQIHKFINVYALLMYAYSKCSDTFMNFTSIV